MEISFVPYHLKFVGGGGGVEGVLLRETLHGESGYACLQPWTRLGDLPLPEHLASLREEKPTELASQSRKAMEIDRLARQAKRSALQGLEIPASHFLLRAPGEAENIPLLRASGFTHVKCKFLPETELLERYPMIWRVDPNSSLTESQVLAWWRGLSGLARERIEFIEDPCPYDRELYVRLSQELPLAIDWHCRVWSERPFAVKALVMKPAAFDILPFAERMTGYTEKLVVTSSLDHPLGQCYAAHQAARLKEEFPRKTAMAGLNSHSVFQVNEFSQVWNSLTPRFSVPDGAGFGFDDLLENLVWETL